MGYKIGLMVGSCCGGEGCRTRCTGLKACDQGRASSVVCPLLFVSCMHKVDGHVKSMVIAFANGILQYLGIAGVVDSSRDY